ncbi:nuclear transport factor 2 family protein [uncultured Hymenobacter sp.]|uniref:nuclear transport factor 2 family protein n=1 Tax=uncultured Hymenobacter sp. TaxID=170016 RepID=UPI0035CA4020
MFALPNICRLIAKSLLLVFSIAAWPAAAQTAPALTDSTKAPTPLLADEPAAGEDGAVAGEAADVPAALAAAATSSPLDSLMVGELRRLNEQWTEATVRNDAQALNQLMAPDYVFVNSKGQVLRRPDILRAVASGRAKAVVNKGFDYQIRVYGDVGVVMHNTSFMGSLHGQSVSGEYRSTDLYVRRNGRWQLTNSHTTYVAPPAEHGAAFSARR